MFEPVARIDPEAAPDPVVEEGCVAELTIAALLTLSSLEPDNLERVIPAVFSINSLVMPSEDPPPRLIVAPRPTTCITGLVTGVLKVMVSVAVL